MKRSISSEIVSLALLAVLVSPFLVPVALVKSNPKTITVPDDYPTIQQAVGNASAGDTVFVKAGTYVTNEESIIEINKTLKLIGENPNTVVIIEIPIYRSLHYYQQPILVISANDVTVSGFTIKDAQRAITTSANSSRIVGNNIMNNVFGTFGIDLGGNDHFVSENNITGGYDGISVGGSGSVITGNKISGNQLGIIAVESQDVTISGNTFSHNGIYDNNTGSYDFGGLDISWWGPFYVYGNTIVDNIGYGINFGENCSNSRVYENNILRNHVGVYLQNFALLENEKVGSGNVFYRNNLINNSQNALVEHIFPYNITNISYAVGNGTDIVAWDNGNEGNYWSDYLTKYPNATEIDNSGIGNTPYILDANNTDHYPHLKPIVTVGTEPFPTTWGAVASVTVIAVVAVAGYLFYKRKKSPESQGRD